MSLEPALGRRIRVLLVDDSAAMRKLMADQLSLDPELEIVGSAMDAYVAREKMGLLSPDVMVLDLGLPRLSGVAFLRRLMRHRPMPVIAMSREAGPGSDLAIEALEAGAFDVFQPRAPLDPEHLRVELSRSIKQAGRFRQQEAVRAMAAPAAVARKLRQPGEFSAWDRRQLIVLGASTGGTEALKEVLTRLPADLPGICIVQHIPPKFSRSFADRLNGICELEVREAEDGDLVEPGVALIAPGDFHMELVRADRKTIVRLNQQERVHHQRPAVDPLFASAARLAGPWTVAALMTGMGRDGAEGLLQLRQAGARTIAQDEASCVVYGMPQAALQIGAVEEMMPLSDIAAALVSRAERIRRMAQEGRSTPLKTAA